MMMLRTARCGLTVAMLACAMLACSQAPSPNMLKQLAWRYSEPGGDEVVRRRSERETGVSCAYEAHRAIAFSGDGHLDHLGAALAGESCSEGTEVVAITLRANGGSEGGGADVIVDGRVGDFFSLYGGLPYDQQIQANLRKLIEGDPFPASLLPEWSQDAVVPRLPLGIVYKGGAERGLYEAIRAQNRSVWCYSRYERVLTCYAHAPGRVRAVEVLDLSGFGPYRLRTTDEFVDVLRGRRPALTQEQYDRAQREELGPVQIVGPTR